MYFQKMGSGKPILFLHGWGCDGEIFSPVAKLLPNCSCYLVDFVGFGKSEKPPKDGWTVFDYAQDTANFLQSQNLQNVTVVGHSFGCRIAILLASQYPQLVGKLFLVAPAGLRKFSFERCLKVARYKIYKLFCRLGFSQNVTARFGSADYNACDDSMKNTFVKVVNQNLAKYAKMIGCSTLIVNGKQDVATPVEQAKKLNKLIANSTLVEIEGDHFAFFKNPQAFARAIQIFEGGK